MVIQNMNYTLWSQYEESWCPSAWPIW